jgi:hypothetical protein
MNRGRPQNEKHICTCCNKEFKDARKKVNHEYSKRKTNKKHQSQATASINGESLVERVTDFPALEK